MGSSVVSKLPEDWLYAKIDDISVKGEQRKPDEDENFIYVDIGSIDRESKEIKNPQNLIGKDAPSRARKVINSGDVLVSLTRPNLNAVALVNNELDNQIASTGFEVIKPIIVESRYLFALVRSRHFVESISGQVQGALYPAAKSSDVKAYEFPLPPLPEQKQIAAKLDALLAQVDSLKTRLDAIPTLLKRFRQSVLAAAVSGRLTADWRENSVQQIVYESEYELTKTIRKQWHQSRLREFERKKKKPKSDSWKSKCPNPQLERLSMPGWYSFRLEYIAEVFDPNPSHRMPKYVTDGVPFISSENIDGESLDFSIGKQITAEELSKQKERYEVTEFSFAFTRIGTIGKSVRLTLPHEYGISHAMAVVTPYVELINGDYLRLAISCTTVLAQAKDGVQSVGVPDLGIGKMKNFLIPVPPLEEQTQIVQRVETLFAFADQIEQRVKDAQARVNQLTQSILAKAFRGELTAEWRAQHPELISGEHSAEALLARIQAERAALASPRKSKKKRGG
ncbi:MAG: restriction endonuclease subunit S [Chloroflexota bacterium]